MFLHVSVILSTGGGIPACLAGLQGVVSQHALQVSRGVVSQHALQVSRGVVSQHALQVSRGVSGPHLGVSRPTPRGVSRPTPRGSPGPHLGVCVSQYALKQTPPMDGYCHGQYASYWNAFLFCCCFLFEAVVNNFNFGPGLRQPDYFLF